MSKNIAKSLLMIGVTLAMVTGATLAFFSDTETSELNTFTAGEINLTIDNTAYYNKVADAGSTWGLVDLTNELFFSFADLKPGDTGEDTISYHVENNNAWGCFNVMTTGAAENNRNEPEIEDGDVTDGDFGGELDNSLNYIFWKDDGDNVLETDEVVYEDGLFTEFATTPGTTYILADSVTNNTFGGTAGQPVDGTSTTHIGFGWCYGTLAQSPVAQGAGDPTTDPGFTCNGGAVDNMSQSDDVELTMKFYAVQQRNNTGFECSDWTP